LAADLLDQAALALDWLLHCFELAGIDLPSVLACVAVNVICLRVKKMQKKRERERDMQDFFP
jgi:hypothetical protein